MVIDIPCWKGLKHTIYLRSETYLRDSRHIYRVERINYFQKRAFLMPVLDVISLSVSTEQTKVVTFEEITIHYHPTLIGPKARAPLNMWERILIG
jgi:hypothetical protein